MKLLNISKRFCLLKDAKHYMHTAYLFNHTSSEDSTRFRRASSDSLFDFREACKEKKGKGF